MKANPSPLHRFAEQIQPFIFRSPEEGEDAHRLFFGSMREELPKIPSTRDVPGREGIRDYLDAVQHHLSLKVPAYLEAESRALAIDNLKAAHAFPIMFRRTYLVDALHRFAFELALDELPLLAEMCRHESELDLESKTQHTERKRSQLEGVRAQRQAEAEAAQETPAQMDYYGKLIADLEAELEQIEASQSELEQALPHLRNFRFNRPAAEARMVLFARGGYGRAELSFSSDIDTGYCLDTRGLNPGESLVFHELVRRAERLVSAGGLGTVHQFFELEEDLSRFGRPETLHTVPAILESRAIAGNADVLLALRERFFGVVSFETLVRKKVEEFNSQPKPSLTRMDTKSDFGGLRSIQIPLWLLGTIHKADSFMTTDLLQLGRQQKVLSLWEVSRLLLGIEFLSELRNFTGAAERHYYDREARESGFHVTHFNGNQVDDQLAGLYLFRSRRFDSLDEFDAYRLQLVDEVQRISTRLMDRVLDRTITHKTESLRIAVHLGRKCIEAINSAQNGGSADIKALFQNGRSILALFAYIAETDYDLSDGLKDALAGAVLGLSQPEAGNDQAEQVRLFSDIMLAPYAHRALSSLLEVNDPLAPDMPSLLGCFIPAVDRARFLVRRFDGEPMVMQFHMLQALRWGQLLLDELEQEHPDLAAMLEREDRLALKWSLFLADIGRIEGEQPPPSKSAEMAADILSNLGYREQELERKVRLMIEHHSRLIRLARTATYMDQALAQLFEIAERDLTRALLVYLVNMAILHARGEDARGDEVRLRQMFNEALSLMGEMRGFPLKERSLELINQYFDRKKVDLIADTRLHRLYQKVIAEGLGPIVAEPLRAWNPERAEALAKVFPELDRLQHELVLGTHTPRERGRLETRLLQELRRHLGQDGVEYLLRDEAGLMSWFFHAYPNRYLMAARPTDLALEMLKFADFAESDVIVDVLPAPAGGVEGLLICTRGLSQSHSHVAYALSRMNLNIVSGKVNEVAYEGSIRGYCYHIEFSRLNPDTQPVARELEMTIQAQNLPEPVVPDGMVPYERRGVRMEFRGNDEKGYHVVPEGDGYRRIGSDYHHIRLVLRDRPFLFYKVCRAFDLFEVDVHQALITTTGNQVLDYFYLAPEDYERLRHSNFEEVCTRMIQGDLLEMVR